MLKESDIVKIASKERVPISSTRTKGLKVFALLVYMMVLIFFVFDLLQEKIRYLSLSLYLLYFFFFIVYFIFLKEAEINNDLLTISGFLNSEKQIGKNRILSLKTIRMGRLSKYLVIKLPV